MFIYSIDMSDFNDYKMNDEVSDDDDEVRTLEAKDYGKVAFTETFDAGKLSYILEHKDSYRDMFGEIDPKYNPFVIAKKYLDASCKGKRRIHPAATWIWMFLRKVRDEHARV